MKKFFTTTLAFLTIASSNSFAANSGFYTGLSGDLTIKKNIKFSDNGTNGKIENKFNSGVNLSLGYDFGNNFRTEAEAGYHAFGMKKITEGDSVISSKPKADLKVMTLMGNVYYDFNNSTRFSPYIGAGAGVSFVDFPTKFFNTAKSKDSGFAYQFMTGVAYSPEFLPSTKLYAGYRYLNNAASQFSIKDSNENFKINKLGASNIELGIRYSF